MRFCGGLRLGAGGNLLPAIGAYHIARGGTNGRRHVAAIKLETELYS